MEIVGMERNSEWKIEEERGKRMEHTGNKTENTKATALITAVHRERYGDSCGTENVRYKA